MGSFAAGSLEPSNFRNQEYCISVGHSDTVMPAAWNDISCSILLPFMCTRRLGAGPFCPLSTATLTPVTSSSVLITPSSGVPTSIPNVTVVPPITCGDVDLSLPYLLGSSISCTGNSVGSTCSLSCRSGLRLYGNSTLVCDVDGTWKGACGFACSSWTLFNATTLFDYRGSPRLSFSGAEAYCEAFGGSLASIHSKAENTFVFNLMPVAKQPRWIGASRSSDIFDADFPPYTWHWTDGSVVDIFPQYYPPTAGGYVGCAFSSGINNCCTQNVDCLWMGSTDLRTLEPNNFKNSEYCVSMGHSKAVSNASWNDLNCNVKIPFVCQRVLESGPFCRALSASSTTSMHYTGSGFGSESTGMATASTGPTNVMTSTSASTVTTTSFVAQSQFVSIPTDGTTVSMEDETTSPEPTTSTEAATTMTTTVLTTTQPCRVSFELVGYTGVTSPNGPLKGNFFANRTGDFLAELTIPRSRSGISLTNFQDLCFCECLKSSACASIYIYQTRFSYFCVRLQDTSMLIYSADETSDSYSFSRNW